MSSFSYKSTVLPGQRINLVAGLQPNANEPFVSSLADGTPDPVQAILGQTKPEDAFFGPFPELTPCKNWTALVNAFFASYTVEFRPNTFGGAAVAQKYSSQSVAINKQLADWFGIKPEHATDDAGVSFVLGKISRHLNSTEVSLSSPSAQSFYDQLSSAFVEKARVLTETLKSDGNNSGLIAPIPRNIDPILHFIAQDFGSHFVKLLNIGDLAFQVFVFDYDTFARICQAADKDDWSGPSALDFRYYTSDNYLKYPTPVRLLSGDPNFEAVTSLLKDDRYGLNQSLLMFNKKARNEAKDLGQLTCTGVQLVGVIALSLELQSDRTLFAFTSEDYERSSVASLLKDVTIQSFICCFGDKDAGSSVVLNHNTIDYAMLYASFSRKDTVSLLWSPYLSVTQMYIRLDDLWKQQAMNKSGVHHLILVADVIEVEGEVDLSEVQNVTLACRLFIARAVEGSTPSIKLSDTAWKPLQFYCGSMIGTCIFQNAKVSHERRVVFDSFAVSLASSKIGVVYDDFFAGKFPHTLLSPDTRNMDSDWRSSVLQTGLDTLLMSAAVPLSPQVQLDSQLQQTAIEAWKCLDWILTYSRQAVEAAQAEGNVSNLSPELVQVYMNALALSRSVDNPSQVTGRRVPRVPPLRYTAFQDAVNKLLEVAKDFGKQISEINAAIREKNAEIQRNYQDSTLNNNIRRLANFLIDQNSAFAAKENDLVNHHNQIINKKQDIIVQLNQREQEIREQLKTLKPELEEARNELTKAIEKKVQGERAKLIIDFALGLTEALFGIYFGIESFKYPEGEGVQKFLQKLEAFLKIVESLTKLKEAIQEVVEKGMDAIELAKTTPVGALEQEAPNETDWELFLNGAEAQVKPAEEFVPAEVANYIAAIRNMTAVGKSLIPVLQQKARLEFDIFAEESGRQVNQRQTERLAALKDKLNIKNLEPGHDYVADLGRFNAILQQKQNSVLLTLTRLVALQDASMTYHYLSQPTVITHFDISSLRNLLAVQAANAVRALETYPYPPIDLGKPRVLKLEEVDTAALTSEKGVTFEIPINHDAFLDLVRVRINSVDVRVAGVKTEKGECKVEMESLGDLMHDRGLERDVLTFKTISRKYKVTYDIATDETTKGTKPAEEWGKLFTKFTPFQKWRIRLPATIENKGLEFSQSRTTVTVSFMLEAIDSNVPALQKEEHRLYAALDADKPITTPPLFVSQLKGHSITDGWDVLTFVSVEQINQLWKQRWAAEVKGVFQGDPTFLQEINVEMSEDDDKDDLRIIYRLEAKLGPPNLQFLKENSQEADVEFPLIEAKVVRTIIEKGEEPKIKTTPIKSEPDKPTLIAVRAPLQKLQGEVENNTVYINPLEGVFTFKNVTFKPEFLNVALSNKLASYIKEKKLQPWKLGTVSIPANQDFLKPRVFNFRTYTPPESRKDEWPAVLCLHILTTTSNPPDHGMRHSWLAETWPISREFDAAVYFSADLLWKEVILPSTKQVFSNPSLNKDEDTKTYKIVFSGSLEVFREKYKIFSNNAFAYPEGIVNFPLSEVEFALELNQMILSCNASWQDQFPHQAHRRILTGHDSMENDYIGWSNVKFECKFTSIITPYLERDNVNISFPKFDIKPDVSVKVEENWLLFMELPRVSDSIAQSAAEQLKTKLFGWEIQLGSLSLFAVSNLLFPNTKCIDPKGVFFPSDMVLIGNVTREWKPPGTH